MRSISRRGFIKSTALVSASVLTPGFLKAFGVNNMSGTTSAMTYNGKRLVVIQLSGGNDGLNTVVPLGNDNYYKFRPQISIPANQTLRISGDAGFNSAMKGFAGILEKNELLIINNTGYPNPDRSHFRSMEIWHTASDTNEYLNSGWIGRYLDSECSTCVHPYSAIETDSTLALAMKGETRSGMAVKDPDKFVRSVRGDFLSRLSSLHEGNGGSEIDFLYKVLTDVTSSAGYVKENASLYSSKFDYPNTEFGRNLKTIAEMINSGVESSVYYVSLSGFDTHVGQNGRHERLLKELSEGIQTFCDDLRTSDNLSGTLVMCFSEFGRRVRENASRGTDHGAANNLFIAGGSLKLTGMFNALPDLNDLSDGDITHSVDFRSVYSSILRNWLGADDRLILGRDFGDLNFV